MIQNGNWKRQFLCCKMLSITFWHNSTQPRTIIWQLRGSIRYWTIQRFFFFKISWGEGYHKAPNSQSSMLDSMEDASQKYLIISWNLTVWWQMISCKYGVKVFTVKLSHILKTSQAFNLFSWHNKIYSGANWNLSPVLHIKWRVIITVNFPI